MRLHTTTIFNIEEKIVADMGSKAKSSVIGGLFIDREVDIFSVDSKSFLD